MKTALFIVSTWGDGEPPDDAAEFWYKLESAELDLTGLNYAVLGLGDKDYADFNGFARQLDERLTKLGATQLTIRADADLDFEDTFVEWSERVLTVLATRQVAATAS